MKCRVILSNFKKKEFCIFLDGDSLFVDNRQVGKNAKIVSLQEGLKPEIRFEPVSDIDMLSDLTELFTYEYSVVSIAIFGD